MRAALLAALFALAGCTLEPLFFSSRQKEGPYDLSRSTVAADRYEQEVFVEAQDGTRVHLILVKARADAGARAATTVLYCHGNGGNLGTHWDRVEHLHGLGYTVLVFDYRGYGRSAGRPSEEGLYQDADAAYAYLRQRAGGRVVLYGHSLGAAVCTELARRRGREIAGLLLEAPFRSIEDMIEDNAGVGLPRHFLTELRFDNYAKMRRIETPLFILHGTADLYIMPRYGVELHERALEPKALWLVDGAGHSTIPGDQGTEQRQEYLAQVAAFVDGPAEFCATW